MEFIVCQEPKRHLDLLLLADPYEPMIDRYLSKSIVLTAEEKGKTVGLVAYCPVENGAWEIKNLAVDEAWQGKEWAGRWCNRSKTVCRKAPNFWLAQPRRLRET